jgi:hypothetical protein
LRKTSQGTDLFKAITSLSDLLLFAAPNQASFQNSSSFGSPSSSFGSSSNKGPFSAVGQPAFGQSLAPSSQGFGKASNFGSQTPFGGATFGQQNSTFGQSVGSGFGTSGAIGTSGAFGQPAAGGATGGFGTGSGFGTSGGFGQPSTAGAGGFGQPAATGGFGQPAAGGATGGFGTSSGFGTSGGFGQPSTAGAGGFGQPAKGLTTGSFGTSSGFGTSGGFGQPSTAGAGGFGQPAATGAFGQPAVTGGFGQPQATSGFGQLQATSGFGQPAASGGFGQPSTTGAGGFGQPQAMSGFGQPAAGGATGGFGTSSGFGTSGGFGQPSTAGAGGFGQPAATGGFGQPTAGGATGGFGTGSGFGTSGGFGQPSTAGAGGFGQHNVGGGFGQGNGKTVSFGQPAATGGFGQPAAGGATGGFGTGSGFGTSGGFGQPSTAGATGGFGQPSTAGAGGFGQPSTAIAGGFGQPAVGGGFGFSGTGGFGTGSGFGASGTFGLPTAGGSTPGVISFSSLQSVQTTSNAGQKLGSSGFPPQQSSFFSVPQQAAVPAQSAQSLKEPYSNEPDFDKKFDYLRRKTESIQKSIAPAPSLGVNLTGSEDDESTGLGVATLSQGMQGYRHTPLLRIAPNPIVFRSPTLRSRSSDFFSNRVERALLPLSHDATLRNSARQIAPASVPPTSMPLMKHPKRLMIDKVVSDKSNEDDIKDLPEPSPPSELRREPNTVYTKHVDDDTADRVAHTVPPVMVSAKSAVGAPKLSQSSDYITSPHHAILQQMDDFELSRVNKFTVMRPNFGMIAWEGETDVRGLDLDDIVDIQSEYVSVYEGKTPKPALGSGLNKSAIITLQNIFPDNESNFLDFLVDNCKERGAEHLDYDPDSGVWQFRVFHFSRYGLLKKSQKQISDQPPGLFDTSQREESHPELDSSSDVPKLVIGQTMRSNTSRSAIQSGTKTKANLVGMDCEDINFMDSEVSTEVYYSTNSLMLDIFRSSYSAIPCPPTLSSSIRLLHEVRKETHSLSMSPKTYRANESYRPSPLCMGSSFRAGFDAFGRVAFPFKSSEVHCVQIVRMSEGVPNHIKRPFTHMLDSILQVSYFNKQVDSMTQGFIAKLQHPIAIHQSGLRNTEGYFSCLELLTSWSDIIQNSCETVPDNMMSTAWIELHCIRLVIAMFGQEKESDMHTSFELDCYDESYVGESGAPSSLELRCCKELSDVERRRQFLSSWLENAIKSISSGVHSEVPSIRVMFDQISRHQIEEAISTAQSLGLFRLSSLLASIGCDPSFTFVLYKQLMSWRQSGMIGTIDPYLYDVYRLLGGDISVTESPDFDASMNSPSSVLSKVNWLRGLGIIFWYACNDFSDATVPMSFRSAVSTFLNALDAGVVDVPLGPCGEDSTAYHALFSLIVYLSAPREFESSEWLSLIADSTAYSTHKMDHSSPFLVVFMLMCVNAHSNSPRPTHPCVAVLRQHVISELLWHGDWNYAVLVAMLIDDDFQRSVIVKDLVMRYSGGVRWNEREAHSSDDLNGFVHHRLNIPESWIHEATKNRLSNFSDFPQHYGVNFSAFSAAVRRASRACCRDEMISASVSRPVAVHTQLEIAYSSLAGMWTSLSEIICFRSGPTALFHSSCAQSELFTVLEELECHLESLPADFVKNWPYQCGSLLKFMRLRQRLADTLLLCKSTFGTRSFWSDFSVLFDDAFELFVLFCERSLLMMSYGNADPSPNHSCISIVFLCEYILAVIRAIYIALSASSEGGELNSEQTAWLARNDPFALVRALEYSHSSKALGHIPVDPHNLYFSSQSSSHSFKLSQFFRAVEQ